MDQIPAHFQLTLTPQARPDSIVLSGSARFTVLTPRMIRIEWSPTGNFEDRASQAFWFRRQPAVEFSSQVEEGVLVLETQYLRLHYRTGTAFASDTLWIDGMQMNTTWHFGDPDPGNLGGTARTLDGVDGAVPVSLGLVSRTGWSVVDDSNSLVFNENSWLEPRDAPEGQLDLVFFGYGHDYLGCLREFNHVSGSVPMIPRYVLGNWWSRYWEYTHDELTGLIEDFQQHEVPLSVCIIDMDWHITKTGNACTGWTGYTWNRELFPDPEGTLHFLHQKGLKVALNLHPAEGVHAHEDIYPEMCAAVGLDAQTQEPVEFDITNPRFVDAYFRVLHHKHEDRGVDFWWMDWQQGKKTRLSGLDPLWWLNHLHFLDLGRDGKRRSFIFSRWGGLGNHRYPIGFSGDSIITWASLAFQPYFTATSSNVNYGWWSHDIGGHYSGVEEPELYLRWVQFGVFSPVMRLHSTKNAFHERRPWGHDAETFEAARDAMQLRHSLIPYLYSMAWRFHHENVPPLLPMYYEYPEQEEAYACPNQYLFGSQLLVAPFITPKDPDTRLSRAVVWLPEGDWYDYFSGLHYPGNGWQARYGSLREIPVFARAGAIVPESPRVGWGGLDTPDRLTVNIFPAADGSFDLYDDEGNSNDYLRGRYALTPFRQSWGAVSTTLTIGPAAGDTSLLPARRTFDLRFRGFARPESFLVRINGEQVDAQMQYSSGAFTLSLDPIELSAGDTLEVTLQAAAGSELSSRDDSRLPALKNLVQAFRLETLAKADLYASLPDLIEDPVGLGRFLPQLTESHFRALMEVITGAGIDRTASTGEELVVVWNNRQDENIRNTFALTRLRYWYRHKERRPWSHGALPRFQAVRPKVDFGEGNPWIFHVDYFGLRTVRVGNEGSF